MKIVTPFVELLSCTELPAQLLEKAGRVCYKTEDKITENSAEPFVSKIANVFKHESVIEHASATFLIVTDRGISHEIVRHRIASYSQESTRYVNYGTKGGEIQVIEPPGLQDEGADGYNGSRVVWVAAMRVAEDAYLKLVAAGVKPQIARSVLPTCTKTELVMTANFREWRHFIKMRAAPNAHPQIQPIAKTICMILHRKCPCLFPEDYRELTEEKPVFSSSKEGL